MRLTSMSRGLRLAALACLCLSGLFQCAPVSAATETHAPEQKAAPKQPSKSTADHSKFEALKGPFANGSEVTKACLTCHNKAGHQFMKSIHWTWEYHNPKTGQTLGKKTLINNF